VGSKTGPVLRWRFEVAVLELSVVLQLGLLVLLPQLAGLLLTRIVRRASWTTWPAAAIAVFGVVWHEWLWVPARNAAERFHTGCGMWAVGLGFILVAGLLLHLGAGVLFALLAHRLRRSSRRAPVAGTPE
jgi:predicted Na+-dependent transporter